MASVQRKLVHKQFNSPMGLYSQENVKATLNRELKAFGGEGIEVDEQIKLNLANSAVLRAVEEEEQQAKSELLPAERQSRSRQRGEGGDALHHTPHNQLLDQIKTHYLSHQQDVTIDRDTVLKINRMASKRHLLKRDHSWPPAEQAVASNAEPQTPPLNSSSSFSSYPSYSIEALREKFQSPTMIHEPTAREVREQRQREGNSKERSRTPQRISGDRELAEVFHQSPVSKGFSAPETKAADVDLGLVAPRCEYYEQLAQKRPTTPTLPTPTPYRPRPKRQSYSLDRGRSRKRIPAASVGDPELPPPKPRTSKPQVQRRCIKLATEVKISYGHEGDTEEEAVLAKAFSDQEVDLEAMPLPPTPPKAAAVVGLNQVATADRKISDSLAVKQQQQMALALATNGSGTITHPSASPTATRIVPVRVEASHPSPRPSPSAQQIYDDACSYLMDNQEREHQDSPTYVSATGGIKLLQRQASKPAFSAPASPAPASPAPASPAPPSSPAPIMRPKSGEDSANKVKQSRRQGGIYTLETDPEKQHEAHVEIAQLEAKYAHIQQSIAEHLRQIDSYMVNAKQALERSVQNTPVHTPTPPTPPPPPPPPPALPARPLSSSTNDSWDIFAHRQSPILAVESPLQAILRQIYTRAAGLPASASKEPTPAEVPEESLTENVPIVERALEDLHKIAQALERRPEQEEEIHVELRTTPAAIQAQHVVIADEDVDVEDVLNVEEYRHVSDVIANYEQLAKKELEEWKEEQVMKQEQREEQVLKKEQVVKKEQMEEQQKEQREEQQKEQLINKELRLRKEESPVNKDPRDEKGNFKEEKKESVTQKEELEKSKSQSEVETESCTHDSFSAACCPVCDELRNSPNNWGKLTKADQWRIANLHNEPLENYKATYEVRSPYISRQISWEDAQAGSEKSPPEKLKRQRSFVEIVTTAASDSPPATPPLPPPPPPLPPPRLNLRQPEVTWERSRSPSPLPSRKYPAPLIEAPPRASSPFGLNPVQGKAPPSPVNLSQKYTHIPQLEGHNIGLLVKTATEPLQQSMSASSSMLASTPPATPRSQALPSPFDFSHLDADLQNKFRSLASFDEVQQQASRDFGINRSFDNVSPRPYLGIEGYKRVAWPPASEERIIREFTPQPASQSPAPGSGGYYPQSAGAAPPHAAAAPPQGPIYNNVQPRTTQSPAPQQSHYGPPPTNSQYPDSYPYQQQQQQHQHQQQEQPVQYTQAQFNRQRSREPVQAPAPAPAPVSDYSPDANAYPNYQTSYPQQEALPHAGSNVGGGWKHIGAPHPKSHNEFTALGGAAAAPTRAPFQGSGSGAYQQPQQQQQPYGGPAYGGNQPQQPAPQWQQQQPAPQWQQQQQQPAPQQPYQPQAQVPAQAPYQQPQWNQQQPQQQQPPYQASPYQQQAPPPQQQQQQQPSYYPQQNGGSTFAQPQYNSYSQPQQQQQSQLPYSQDQTDLQPGAGYPGQDNSYRGASPGIITLRKEAPVSQQPAPVYTSQPAAVSYQGGSKLRGDLKWPPPEYKEAAARENEERRQLALGPVCRPRRINRDYTPFFARHQLNNAYPSYKVPPGTQHMFG